MSAIFAILTSRVAGMAYGVMAIGLAIALVIVKVQNGTLHDEIDNPRTGYKAELAIAQGNAQTLKGGLDQCNGSILDIKKASDAATAAAEQAFAAAKAAGAAAQKSASEILKAKPGKDVCASADQLILERTR